MPETLNVDRWVVIDRVKENSHGYMKAILVRSEEIPDAVQEEAEFKMTKC